MLKLSDNPAIRPAGFASVRDMPGDWWVAHTKSRCEKTFARDLEARGIAYFLPLVKRTLFSGGRKRTAMMPLFNGYMFFAGDTEARYHALCTDRLCAVIPVNHRDVFVEQIAAIEQTLETNLPIDIFPFAVVGRRVKVRYGQLAGVVGTIVQRQSVNQLVVEVSILQQAVAMPIDAEQVVPLDE